MAKTLIPRGELEESMRSFAGRRLTFMKLLVGVCGVFSGSPIVDFSV